VVRCGRLHAQAERVAACRSCRQPAPGRTLRCLSARIAHWLPGSRRNAAHRGRHCLFRARGPVSGRRASALARWREWPEPHRSPS
jgi:hypothetical protein